MKMAKLYIVKMDNHLKNGDPKMMTIFIRPDIKNNYCPIDNN